MEFRVFNRVLMMLLGVCVVAGCTPDSGPTVETVDVSGTVTLDGEPAEGIAVRFFKSLDHEGAGVTGPDGKYELGNGAEPGENKVYFFKVDSVDGEEEEDIAGGAEADPEAEEEPVARDELPAKYSSSETTEVTFTVPEGGTSAADFKLTSE